MTYAVLMVHVEPGMQGVPRLSLACDLAQRFDALLIGFAAETVEPAALHPFGGVEGLASSIEPEQERVLGRLRSAERRFQAAAGGILAGRQIWRAFMEPPAQAMLREARGADLLILGKGSDEPYPAAAQLPDLAAVVLGAGRPILLVPPGTATLSARTIIVGWKDTLEARRALRDALPFLTQAETVLVVEVCGHDRLNREEAGRRLAPVVEYLASHGVAARRHIHARTHSSIADDLISVAEQAGGDLIVAGGYGHARLSEWIFGGVTRDLLQRQQMCCLLSH